MTHPQTRTQHNQNLGSLASEREEREANGERNEKQKKTCVLVHAHGTVPLDGLADVGLAFGALALRLDRGDWGGDDDGLTHILQPTACTHTRGHTGYVYAPAKTHSHDPTKSGPTIPWMGEWWYKLVFIKVLPASLSSHSHPPSKTQKDPFNGKILSDHRKESRLWAVETNDYQPKDANGCTRARGGIISPNESRKYLAQAHQLLL